MTRAVLRSVLVREVPRRETAGGSWLVTLLVLTFVALVPLIAAMPRGGFP